jgi:hypothetical protein
MKPSPLKKEVEFDFDVDVEQGNTKRTLPIVAPNKDKALSKANRILESQGVKPFKVIKATISTRRKP